MPDSPESTNEIRLATLRDEIAPAPLVNGWRTFLGLPRAAIAEFWAILAPILITPNDDGNNNRVKEFCKHHSVDPVQFLTAAETVTALVRHAAAIGLDAARFREDLSALCGEGDAGGGVEAVMAQYDVAKGKLREQALHASLGDHGSMLTGIHWRVDTLGSSDHALNLNVPITLLTLSVREGGEDRRMTMQVPPDALKALKRMCDQLLG